MNRRRFLRTASAAVILATPVLARAQASDRCRVFAELSVELAARGAFLVCLRTGNPLACAIAGASQSVATKGVAKQGVASGCEWLMQKLGDSLAVRIDAPASSEPTVREAVRTLKAVGNDR